MLKPGNPNVGALVAPGSARPGPGVLAAGRPKVGFVAPSVRPYIESVGEGHAGVIEILH